MGVSLNICYLCGIIGYDENFNNDYDYDNDNYYCNNYYCINDFNCCLRMCNSTEEYVEDCKLIFKNYINIRYVSRKLYIDNTEEEFFNSIYWLCKNIKKCETDEFIKKLEFVNSFSY